MWISILAVFFGAGFGALLRAGFNVLTVNAASIVPMGTLISNMVGGYLVGLSVAWLGAHPDYPPEVKERAKGIRLLILDVDGVLTDGSLYFGPTGEALKVFHVRDGHGIKMLQKTHL